MSTKVWCAAWDVFYEAYEGSGRFYHTLNHIHKCFTAYDEVVHLFDDPLAVALAIWFHDIEYDTKRSDNEERSAALLLAVTPTLKLDPTTAEKAAHMILHTKHHGSEGLDNDTKLFLDIDLSILGSSPDEYDTYADDIRKEYAWVPDEMYRESRKAILESFLARGKIFQTEAFGHLEAPARANIQRELGRLKETT